ncbi:MAG: arylesterase [Termitinemataceae bacterium]|nr:MAG: arylesterase [Termitinemataceae bacterium]
MTIKTVFGIVLCLVFVSCSNSKMQSTIVCFGDSITSGYGVEKTAAYPALLQDLVKTSVINSGLEGDTAHDAIKRVKKDVLRYNPTVVIIEFGANDYMNSVFKNCTVDVNEIQTSLRNIIKKINTNKTKIILAKFYNFEMAEYMLGGNMELYNFFEIMYTNLSNEFDIVVVDNIWDGIWGNKEFMNPDKLHPNAAGYEKMAIAYYEILNAANSSPTRLP